MTSNHTQYMDPFMIGMNHMDMIPPSAPIFPNYYSPSHFQKFSNPNYIHQPSNMYENQHLSQNQMNLQMHNMNNLGNLNMNNIMGN
jgi:hypothetical protein